MKISFYSANYVNVWYILPAIYFWKFYEVRHITLCFRFLTLGLEVHIEY